MKKVLLAGFAGEDNASKVVLDKCSLRLEKLYLDNDFSACEAQIKSAVNGGYDFILILGQKPVIKSIYIELAGRYSNGALRTDFDYSALENSFAASGYRVRISENAGNYLCNHVYYHALLASRSLRKNVQILFLHIPYLRKMTDIDLLASVLSDFLLRFN